MKKTIKISHLKNSGDEILIETELEVLTGINNVSVDFSVSEVNIEFNENQTSLEEISSRIESLGFSIKSKADANSSEPKEVTYYVKGMHCASCEVLIENKLLKATGIKSVEASTTKGSVTIEYEDKKPTAFGLSQVFKEDGYAFFEMPIEAEQKIAGGAYKTFFIAGIIIIAFIFLNKLGIGSWINVNSSSSLPVFFVLGVLAGLSSCAALVGGLILSMSKQWLELYNQNDSTFEKLQPHLMFTVGRLASYGLLGAVLGAIGAKLQISSSFTSALAIVVSVLMLFLALQMLGVKAFRRFQFTMPKFVTRYIADESKFKGRYMPAVMGALTFFLPCGFTITAQSLALLSGSPLQGGLIMFLFALGTAPMLLVIGLSSIKFSSRPHLSASFLKVAGILVLFFALFNINAQFNALGLSSLSDISLKSVESASASQESLPPIVAGKQVIKMNASSSSYDPNYFKVKVGVPVRWEITDVGTSGCTNAIVSRGLFSDQIPLTPGQVSVKEFTPTKVGRYKFSCWMGMISGVIEVVDVNNPTVAAAGVPTANSAAAVVPSGAKGCGCGGGGGSSCGGSN